MSDMAGLDADELNRTRVWGKHRGLVSDNADPDGLGEIQVQVPTVLGADVKVWAKPCFASGHFFVPPVGAGVWVEFEAGDPSYPLWVGTWYPPDQIPPEAATPVHDHKVVHTPSGNLIELSDESGKEKVLVRHGVKKSFVALDEEGGALVANGSGSHLHLSAKDKAVSLTSEQGHTVTMTDDGVIIASKSGKTVLTIEGDKVTLAGGTKLALIADSIALSGGSITIGTGAQPMGGTMLKGDAIFGALSTHTHPTAMGPTGPPILIPTPIPPPPPYGVSSIQVG